jgi:hypothetical protein
MLESEITELAEEIGEGLHGLTVGHQVAAIIEALARLLASRGITPGTEAFDGFLDVLLPALAARTRRLVREHREAAH